MNIPSAKEVTKEVNTPIDEYKELDEVELYNLNLEEIKQRLKWIIESKKAIDNPFRSALLRNKNGGVPNYLRTTVNEIITPTASRALNAIFRELERKGYEVGFVKEEPMPKFGQWNYFIVVKIPQLPLEGRYVDDCKAIRENEYAGAE